MDSPPLDEVVMVISNRGGPGERATLLESLIGRHPECRHFIVVATDAVHVHTCSTAWEEWIWAISDEMRSEAVFGFDDDRSRSTNEVLHFYTYYHGVTLSYIFNVDIAHLGRHEFVQRATVMYLHGHTLEDLLGLSDDRYSFLMVDDDDGNAYML